jgi:hypothetical protein
MRLAIGIAVWAVGAAGVLAPHAWAQVDTPPNCHWVSLPKDPQTIEMWCREADGRAHPTGRMMRQAPADVWDGCAYGKVYDGARCVSEAQALAKTNRLWASAPPSAPAKRPEPPKASKPRVLMFQDREGRRGRGMACADQSNVTVCKPIPHY